MVPLLVAFASTTLTMAAQQFSEIDRFDAKPGEIVRYQAKLISVFTDDKCTKHTTKLPSMKNNVCKRWCGKRGTSEGYDQWDERMWLGDGDEHYQKGAPPGRTFEERIEYIENQNSFKRAKGADPWDFRATVNSRCLNETETKGKETPWRDCYETPSIKRINVIRHIIGTPEEVEKWLKGTHRFGKCQHYPEWSSLSGKYFDQFWINERWNSNVIDPLDPTHGLNEPYRSTIPGFMKENEGEKKEEEENENAPDDLEDYGDYSYEADGSSSSDGSIISPATTVILTGTLITYML